MRELNAMKLFKLAPVSVRLQFLREVFNLYFVDYCTNLYQSYIVVAIQIIDFVLFRTEWNVNFTAFFQMLPINALVYSGFFNYYLGGVEICVSNRNAWFAVI